MNTAYAPEVSMITMSDGARLRCWSAGRALGDRLSVIMVHGGPGLPDYLGPVAELITDLGVVHRYDQRGVGGSPWTGEHTMARQVDDLAELMDAWGYRRAILLGHSFGTDLSCSFLLAYPDRVAAMVMLSGPFVGDWREPCRDTERKRRSPVENDRFDELDRLVERTDSEELEYLTLAWHPDHADRDRARAWARAAALAQRPVNYAMNTQLNADKKRTPLESRHARLRQLMPAGSAIIGGGDDPRPASCLRSFADQVRVDCTVIEGAGHHPWLDRPLKFRTALRTALGRAMHAANQS